MDLLTIKYRSYAGAAPPKPIRLKIPGWSGSADKMQDGSEGQPWHCLPFVEASTYALELTYQFENECHIVNDNGQVRIDWDYASEPGGMVVGGEFILFSPKQACKYYAFNTRLDLQPPPGYVIRSEPHPRFFTDDTGTVPLAMIGHLQTEWYPRLFFVVFRAPVPGQRHIFRKGEAYAQLLVVPRLVGYQTTELSPEEAAHRRELERTMQSARTTIADHVWQTSDRGERDNHYKILASLFARDGVAAVEQAVYQAAERRQQALPQTVPQCLALGAQLMREKKYNQAQALYAQVRGSDPNNAEALSQEGICRVCLGSITVGLELMTRAVALEPLTLSYRNSLGEILRLLGRLQDAEAAFRASLQVNPRDPGVLSSLGQTLAQQGRVAEGIEACRAALGLGVAAPGVHYKLGLILAQQRQYREARACYEAALALNPDFADARRALQELPAESRP